MCGAITLSSPKELNFVKNVGDLTLHRGKRMTIKKNGTVCCSCQNSKKLDLSATTKLFVELDDALWPPGQRTETEAEIL